MQLWQKCSVFIAALAFIVLSGCATSPYQTEAKTKSESLLASQLEEAKSTASKPKLWFAGFGLHSTSTAFKLDVAAFAKLAKTLDPNAAVLKLANPAPSQAVNWPYATPENIQTVLREMAGSMGNEDIAIVLLTTHGHVDLLAFNASNVEYAPIRGATLAAWFAPLNSKRVIVVVSACYSGSLINSLIHPNRIILTAAARDRTSFGCQPNSSNTYFIEELLKAMADPSRSIDTAFEITKLNVERKEVMMKLTPPSNPQIRIPPSQTEFARKPFKEWLIQ
jgi:Peptidase C13 family